MRARRISLLIFGCLITSSAIIVVFRTFGTDETDKKVKANVEIRDQQRNKIPLHTEFDSGPLRKYLLSKNIRREVMAEIDKVIDKADMDFRRIESANAAYEEMDGYNIIIIKEFSDQKNELIENLMTDIHSIVGDSFHIQGEDRINFYGDDGYFLRKIHIENSESDYKYPALVCESYKKNGQLTKSFIVPVHEDSIDYLVLRWGHLISKEQLRELVLETVADAESK